jgi:VIT1/CCC1 family predicted Fe2+/Mn2+ transporter
MEMMFMIFGALLFIIPMVIAHKRKCANFVMIDLLSFFLSWTILGWVVALVWAIEGKSDPQKFVRQTNV